MEIIHLLETNLGMKKFMAGLKFEPTASKCVQRGVKEKESLPRRASYMVATDLQWDGGVLCCLKSPLSDHLTKTTDNVHPSA